MVSSESRVGWDTLTVKWASVGITRVDFYDDGITLMLRES